MFSFLGIFTTVKNKQSFFFESLLNSCQYCTPCRNFDNAQELIRILVLGLENATARASVVYLNVCIHCMKW